MLESAQQEPEFRNFSTKDLLAQSPPKFQMTPARAKCYLDTYRLFRESHPLPPGWQDYTWQMEAVVNDPEHDDAKPVLWMLNGCRQVNISFHNVPNLEVEFIDRDGHGFTLDEMAYYLDEFIGLDLDIEELKQNAEDIGELF